MGIRERDDRAAEMPHRRTGKDPLDGRLESTIGRFYLENLITTAEYDAGIEYGKIVLRYLQTIDAPEPYGNGFESLSEETCFLRKVMCSQAREVLQVAARAACIPARDVIIAVDRLAVYGETVRSKKEMDALRVGLRALSRGSNVIPFARHTSQQR